MTPNQREVLRGLRPSEGKPAAWLAPIDFGGGNGSHHGITARRMADAYGWTEWRYRGCEPGQKTTGARGSCLYRITPKGLEALAADAVTRKLAGVS